MRLILTFLFLSKKRKKGHVSHVMGNFQWEILRVRTKKKETECEDI